MRVPFVSSPASRGRRPGFSSLLLLMACGLASPLQAYQPVVIDEGMRRDQHPVLGIGENFGRWNTTVKLVYDPDGAPARFSDTALVLALLQEAVDQWELVSGVRFNLLGADSAAPDDSEQAAGSQDGIVRIHWKDLGGSAGLAGPEFADDYDEDLGYFPYYDGDLALNSRDSIWESNGELVSVTVHELGHVLGLGHSDNPDSIMYADPYNFLSYPRADDIRAVQALYGLPTPALAASEPVSEWQYQAPPTASAATTRFLFKANDFSEQGAHFKVNDAEITSVTASTSSEGFVYLASGGIGGFDNDSDIDIDATLVVVDPSGYVYSERDWNLSCEVGFACTAGSLSVAQASVIKTIPGNWTVYVVDKAKNETLLQKTLAVNTTAAFNRPPRASLSVSAGSSSTQARFTLSAEDDEGHAITAIWHPPGVLEDRDGDLVYDYDIRDSLNGSVTRSLDFSLTGTHTFFIELRDDGPRYLGANNGGAGDGYQTLLQVQVRLPITANSLTVINTGEDAASAGGGGNSGSSETETLQSLTETDPLNVIVHQGSRQSVQVRLAASGDDGVSRAEDFSSRDDILIAGRLTPLAAHVGGTADLYIVMLYNPPGGGNQWRYRDVNGIWQRWNARVPDLKPAVSGQLLDSDNLLQIYDAALDAGTHKVFIGYSPTGSGDLYYNNRALVLQVTD